MNREELYERLNAVFQDVFDDEMITVNDCTTADDIEDWDSLEHINLIVAVEKEFHMKFSMGEINQFKNVGGDGRPDNGAGQMNAYGFEDLWIGQSESFERTITSDMLEKFRELSGDMNPLHTDQEFAREHGFADRVVYGMLTASFISALGGVYLPGKYCLIQSVEIKFAKPVFVGDTIQIIGEVMEIHEHVNQVVIKVTMVNQHGLKVCRGILKAGIWK